MDQTLRQLVALVGLTLVVMAAFGGGVATYGVLQDAEPATATVGAAGNFADEDCPAGNEDGDCDLSSVGILAPVALGAAAPARLVPIDSERPPRA